MANKKFDKSKKHVNIGTIGRRNSGKTTLTAAITEVLSRRLPGTNRPVSYDKIDNANKDTRYGMTIYTSNVEYETRNRHYAHIDCPRHDDYVKNMISGAAQLDAAILVVEATDGVMKETEEQLLLARQAGVSRIVVFLNKIDQVDDEEMIELVELEILESLEEYTFDSGPIIRGSALMALKNPDSKWGDAIMELMAAVDYFIPTPEPERDRPFLMAVEDAFTITGRGTVAIGKVERGTIQAGNIVEIVREHDASQKVAVSGIEMSGKVLDEAWPGDYVGLLFSSVQRGQITRGQVLASPGTVYSRNKFIAHVYALAVNEGGRKTPFFNNYRPMFYFRTESLVGVIRLPEHTEMFMPGDNYNVEVELSRPVPMEEGLIFAIREGGRTVGYGRVTELE